MFMDLYVNKLNNGKDMDIFTGFADDQTLSAFSTTGNK